MIEPHVMDRHEWMVEEHAWPAVTHDGANLFPHITAVTVHGADGAEGFDLHAWAARDAPACIVAQAAAVGAELIGILRRTRAACVFVAAAVDGNHLRHDLGFEGAFLFSVHYVGLSSIKQVAVCSCPG